MVASYLCDMMKYYAFFIVHYLIGCLFPRRRRQIPAGEAEDYPPILPSSEAENSKLPCPPGVCRELSTSSSRSVQTDPDECRPNTSLLLLQDALRRAHCECPHDNYRVFVPESSLSELINEETVRDILYQNSLVRLDKIEDTTQKILRDSSRLFAVLVDRKKTQYLERFLEEDIGDKDLPFIRRRVVGDQALPLKLETVGHRQIRALEGWDHESLKSLETKQYRMIAPVFHVNKHDEFPDLQTLPYVPVPDDQCTVEGGFGEVFQARIHPDHHRFWNANDEGKGPLVAIKKLYSSQSASFSAERKMFDALGAKNSHAHIISLLCTYKKGEKYHLVFPWADGSLRKYWQETPTPHFNARILLWSLRQMVGILSGLSLIHEFSSLPTGESLFGRHGDMKADNILWFRHSNGCDDPDGILQIADLGLASIHSLGSKSNVHPSTVTCPSTYSPPDVYRNKMISRSWDIWSLGCLYLEFVTWILCGYENIEYFSALRGFEDENLELNTDHFYTADYKRVRFSVFEWVARLRRHERCSAAIHSLLDLIMREMIVIEPHERSSAQRVLQQMKDILSKAEQNQEYLLEPVPREDRFLMMEWLAK